MPVVRTPEQRSHGGDPRQVVPASRRSVTASALAYVLVVILVVASSAPSASASDMAGTRNLGVPDQAVTVRPAPEAAAEFAKRAAKPEGKKGGAGGATDSGNKNAGGGKTQTGGSDDGENGGSGAVGAGSDEPPTNFWQAVKKSGQKFGDAAAAAARRLGFTVRVPPQKAPFDSHGQPAFRRGNRFITPDIDSHKGGVWKMYDQKGTRLGTYDADLNRIAP